MVGFLSILVLCLGYESKLLGQRSIENWDSFLMSRFEENI